MTLYEIIWIWFYENIWWFDGTDLENISYTFGNSDYSLNMAEWLSHSCTILTLILLVVCCGLFIRWIFKVISGAILLK